MSQVVVESQGRLGCYLGEPTSHRFFSASIVFAGPVSVTNKSRLATAAVSVSPGPEARIAPWQKQVRRVFTYMYVLFWLVLFSLLLCINMVSVLTL